MACDYALQPSSCSSVDGLLPKLSVGRAFMFGMHACQLCIDKGRC